MSLAAKLKAGLHRKWWDNLTAVPVAPVAQSLLIGSQYGHAELEKHIYYFSATANSGFSTQMLYRYDWTQDSWIQPNQPSSSQAIIPISQGAVFLSLGFPAGANTFSAATSSLNTTSRFATSFVYFKTECRGSKIRCVAGTNAGFESTIASISPTSGSNVITLSTAAPAAFDNTSKFSIWTGSIWVYSSDSSTYYFSVYDCATDQWYAKTTTGISRFINASAFLIATPSIEYGSYDSGTSSGTNTTTTLNDTTKSWLNASPYQWKNYQVRITGGTGIGQVRTISAHTNNQLTVSSAWTTTPDATSTYVIEANDDFIYLGGNATTTFYRYSISGNSWSTMSACSAAIGNGAAIGWVGYSSQSDWTNPDVANISTFLKQNGRYIYLTVSSASSTTVYYYDIVGNSWANFSSSAPPGSTSLAFASGSNCSMLDDVLYIQKENTGFLYSYNVSNREFVPLMYDPTPQGAATPASSRIVAFKHYENGEVLKYIFSLHHGSTVFTRTILI